jgi:hypothetical protein
MVQCYELKKGGCAASGQVNGDQMLSDGEGGFIASIGDNSYDDLAFSIGISSCPQSD